MNTRHLSTFALACGTAVGLAGLALAAHDRHELTRARRAAHTDPLTGLANRAGLGAAWPRLASTAPVLALIDLDGFKPVNDTYGHAAGDSVLVTIADRLRALLPGACVARLGGDEFTAVLPGPIRSAHTQALRIAATVALSVPMGDDAVTVTASIGLAPSAGHDLAQVLATADAAMYRAKTSRSGIAVYDAATDDRTTPAADPRPAVRVRTLHRRADLVELTR
ncbi:hypothetical protein CS0771_07550 [Catellatospora sp. IY07-71]|uniref:GGDEF domain-containing protein n=1 Tax=Catellatospora sp. IY07-71 TaxID=2728827 RepID=UPI001BB38778|nr:GGDEF domain-containing protein [Catellatospora sp. IY07-71]BCJ71211.1 hypothetical protein CS0771_07550 [Catellatospora sp. IY07-71]